MDDISSSLSGTGIKKTKISKTPFSVTYADDFAKFRPPKIQKVKAPLEDIGDSLAGTGVKQKVKLTSEIEKLKVGVVGGTPKIKPPKSASALDNLANVLSGSKIKTRFKPYVFTTQFDKIDTIQKGKGKQLFDMESLFDTPTDVRTKDIVITDVLPATKIKTSTIQIPATIQSPVSNLLLGGYVPIAPRTAIKPPKQPKQIIPKIPFPNFGRGILTPPGKQQGYNVFVKQKGKNIKITKNPLSKPMARDLLTYTLDNSLSATGSFKKTKKKIGKPEYKIPQNYRIKSLNKFRPYKVKKGVKTPLVNKIIEKAPFRLDTRSEVRKIQASKLLASRKIKPLGRVRNVNLSGGFNLLGSKKATKKKKKKNNKIKLGFF